MCTSPIRILNKKYQFLRVDTPRKYIEVPCGSCDECLQRRSNDVYVRANFEYLDCLRSGGCGFMCCLTYGLQLCPYLEYEGVQYKVFNKKDVIDFFKRLRTNLDRYFQFHFNTDAPDFKYLVTAEFGKDENGCHLPHYHLCIFFRQNISTFAFRTNFVKSLVNQKTGERYFGRIFQCALLDPSRGGIKYSAKYVLKDLMYDKQRKIIMDLLAFQRDKVEQDFNICLFPKTPYEYFHNKCIRSSKRYKKAVETACLPYRHMLQFFLCSNDLGVSAIFNRYGKNILSLPLLSIGGFNYPLPKAVKERVKSNYTDMEYARLSKNIFLASFERAANTLVLEGVLPAGRVSMMKDFIKDFVLVQSGFLYLRHENCVLERLYDNFEFPDYSDKYKDYLFHADNDFFSLRDDCLAVIRLFNSPDRLRLRSVQICEKLEKQNKEREQRKKNKGL